MIQLSEKKHLFNGNKGALQRGIQKGKQGKIITILFMGGSITQGEFCKKDCFVNQFREMLPSLFGRDFAFDIVNISMSGTMSSNGIFVTMTEVAKYNPDIIFVDYSVNDTGDRYLWETFEGVIRNLLCLPSNPAVGIFMFSNEWGDSAKGVMKQVGEFYDLPIVDIAQQVTDGIEEGAMVWSDYASDYVHPNKQGHELIATTLCELFKEADVSVVPNKYTLPEGYCFGGHMCNLQLIDQWLPFEKETCGTILYKGTLEFDMMIIEYLQDSVDNKASISVEIDGCLVKILDAYLSYGWGNKMVSFIHQNSQTKTHYIEIKIERESTIENWSFRDFLCGIALGI